MSVDLRVAADFWAAYEECGRNDCEVARRYHIPRPTVRDTRRHHEEGELFVRGLWVRPDVLVEGETAPDLSPLAVQVKEHLRRCKDHQSIEQIADQCDASPKRVREALAQLEADAVLLNVRGDAFALERDLQLTETPLAIDVHKYAEVEIPLGLTADNHIGSKYERMDVLEALFDRFADAGVRTVYQGGNIIDGEARFNKFDVYVRGVEDQVANLIQKWPQRKGMTTHFVTGDDHEGWYTQREHIDVGRKIEQDAYAAGRDDLRHLGYMERDIDYQQSGGAARIRVIHAGGGSAYATSYSSQKYAEMLTGGEKPQIVAVGHFHKFNYTYARGVHIIQLGCTEDQTPFMRKRRIEAHVGGCILWVKQNELGIFTSVRVEWLPFFDKRFYQYKW